MNPTIKTQPQYANVPSSVLLKILCLPKARPKSFEKISPKIRKVREIIAIFLLKRSIDINAATKNKVIDENFFSSCFLNKAFILVVNTTFV